MGNKEYAVARRSSLPPRKVVVATVMKNFTGPMDARLSTAEQMIDQAAAQSQRKYGGKLDLVVLPEHAIQTEKRGGDVTAAQKAVPLEGEVVDRMAAKARQYHTYLIVPLIRAEGNCYTNSAALLDRDGKLVGVYDKIHPVGRAGDARLENGITPGSGFPVFDCDFGRIGIQICWDMSYTDGFDTLGKAGAEIVAIPTASPQTVQPSAHALRNHYYVVTSTPRDNATMFSPDGQVVARTNQEPVLVQRIDLSWAILHWQERLNNGQLLSEAYGDRVGYQYSEREDTGLFWSNDPKTTIGQMLKEQGMREMQDHVEIDRQLQEKARSAVRK
jgi:predicted amidohydrolase